VVGQLGATPDDPPTRSVAGLVGFQQLSEPDPRGAGGLVLKGLRLGAGENVVGAGGDVEVRVELGEGVIGGLADFAVAGRVGVVVAPLGMVGVVRGIGVVVGPVTLADLGVVGGQVAADPGAVPGLLLVVQAPADPVLV
jgi:hypothetical protein